MPYSNPDDRARASKRYYWRRKYRDEGVDFDHSWDANQLKENFHRVQVSKYISPNEKGQPTEKDEKQVRGELFAYNDPIIEEMPITPENYSSGVDDFLTQELEEETQQPRHWSGLSEEAIKRISDGTAPLLFDRDVDLMLVIAEFDDYLGDLEKKMSKEHKEKVWRFI